MELNENEIISAQVILRPSSGKEIGSNTIITSENIQDFQPSQSITAMVLNKFEQYGFQVGQMVGNSFSITAPASSFQKLFHMQMQKGSSGEIEIKQEDGSWDYKLSVDSLPQEIADKIIAITFTPPPAFGPTKF